MSQQSKRKASTSRWDEGDLLVRAVEEYLAMLEVGKSVDVENFVARYPDLGGELRSCLQGLDLVTQVSPSVADASEGQFVGKDIGDFRIIREIGRGGMGVVYEAEQLSLGRTVALKVLPYAAMMDRKAITRFKNEARAAATLDHPHIVPVFAVGIERGIHYYAMSLIEGLTVGELISHLQRSITDADSSSDRLSIDDFLGPQGDRGDDQSRSLLKPTIGSGKPTKNCTDPPTDRAHETYGDIEAAISTYRSRFDGRFFRSVAALGVQAAEALDDAHEHGIVHRDVKPGNLMIDTSTKLWVTDFGLARIESDTGMTMTGDLLGTLRYMAPEQALGRQVAVDHRADIYSLGASLYELLALRPPFDGSSREALLKQIALDEPKPLRHFNRAVPEDLQTIVHKALSKDPGERYTSAQEMAIDLLAFVNDKPIKARRATLLQIGRKWSRRHRALVQTALVTLTVAVVVGGALLWRERIQTLVALQRVTEQRQQAEANLQQAKQAVDTYLTLVSENELLNVPDMFPLREQLLRAALDFYEGLAQQKPDDIRLRLELAYAHFRLSNMHSLRGDPQWFDHNWRALDLMEQLLREGAFDQFERDNWSGPELAKSRPATPEIRGNALHVFDPDQVLVLGQKGVAVFRTLVQKKYRANNTYKNGLAGSLLLYGDALERSNRHDEAVASYQESIELCDQLIRGYPDEPHYLLCQTFTLAKLGILLQGLGRIPEAEEAKRTALSNAEKLVAEHQQKGDYRFDLQSQLTRISDLLLEIDRLVDATPFIRRIIEIAEELANDYPTYQSNGLLAERYRRFAEHLAKTNDLEGARGNFEKFIALDHSDCFATHLYILLSLRIDDWDGYEETCATMIDQFGKNSDILPALLTAWTCALAPGALEDYASVIESARIAVELECKTDESSTCMGALLFRAGQFEQAIGRLLQAGEVESETALRSSAYAFYFLSMAHYRLGQKDEAEEWLARAIARADTVLDDNQLGEPVSWNHRVALDLLRAEAEVLIGNHAAAR